MQKTTKIASLAIAATLVATTIDARDLRIAPAGPPAHPAYYMYEHFVEYLADVSGGSLTATILGPEVVALPQMKDALQTGLVDIGNYLPLYFSAGMDTTNISGNFSLVGRSPHVMALAMTEYVVTCEPCQQEFADTGIVFLGAGSSDVYGLLTTKPVRTAADLAGLRLRSGGAPFTRWAENFGATGVAMGVGATFEGISQGTIDGTMASTVDLLSFRLIDVAKYVIKVPIGTYHVTSNFTVGQGSWDALSDEEKAHVVSAAGRANFDLTDRWAFQLPAAAAAAIENSDLEVIIPDAALLEASEAFIAADSAAGVEAGGAQAASFVALVEKWSAIVAEVGNDPDALSERATAEIWNNVDWSTYGG